MLAQVDFYYFCSDAFWVKHNNSIPLLLLLYPSPSSSDHCCSLYIVHYSLSQ